MNSILPPVWLIIFIVGLPQLSESIYCPTLPQIAHYLQTKESYVEMTLSIYLIGFGIGSLFFGCLSDLIGRKPSILIGLFLFLLGSIFCSFSESIDALLISRFIQAFGGSIGSVLGQAICRDAYKGAELGKVYSSVGSALALFPAIGPMIGTFIAKLSNWHGIFIFLIMMASILFLFVTLYLPETIKQKNKNIQLHSVFKRMRKDLHVLRCSFFVAGANGIAFSYYAESPFYFKKLLNVSDFAFGASFLGLALLNMVGSLINKKAILYYAQKDLIKIALKVILICCLCLSVLAFIPIYNKPLIILGFIGVIFLCVPIITGNALSLALKDYQDCIGTASSLFGFSYYLIISIITLGMAFFHNDTLYSMPLYFLFISTLMIIITYLKRCKNELSDF